MNYLFIGGSADGEVKNVIDDRLFIDVPFVRYEEGPRVIPANSGALVRGKIDYETYQKKKLSSGDKGYFEVYIKEDLPLRDAMLKLLTNYRPAKGELF